MTYEYFLAYLEELMLKRLKTGESVQKVQILKNNGVKLDGFSYCIKGRRERPTVYVNQYYHEQISEKELDDIAATVLKLQRESRLLPADDLAQILDFESVKARIFYRLISRKRNEELLSQSPWLPWLDMAIVFYLRIPEHIVKNATALIHTNHMEQWEITLGELYRTAARNMSKEPVLLEPMESFLENCGFQPLSSSMHVLSNRRKEFGAALIVDPKVQRMCFRKLGEDYYVLPSSIHELILLPASQTVCREELDELVQEVNESCVSREDYLSGHAYFYSSCIGQIG